MSRRRRLAFFAAVALLGALVAGSVFLRAPTRPSTEAPIREIASAAESGREPGTPPPAIPPSAASDLQEKAGDRRPPDRTPAAPATPSQGPVLIRGRLVVRGGGPLGEANVAVRTYKEEIDFPATVARLGGLDAFKELRKYEGEELQEKLRALGGWKAAFESRAEADGSFSVAIPPDHPEFGFEVKADFAVYPDEGTKFRTDDPRIREGIDLLLAAAGKIEGNIRTAEGKPASKGRVLRFESGEYSVIPFPVEAEDDGRFAIRALAPGRYNLVVAAAGGAPAVKKGVEVRAGETTRVEIDLPPECWIAGKVVDESGRGVGRAKVEAHGGDEILPTLGSWNASGLRYGRARTNPDGTFRIGGLMDGKHHVVVAADGLLLPEGKTVDVPPRGGVGDLVFVLSPGHFLSGRVVDPEARPVAGIPVRAVTDRAAVEKRGIKDSVHWALQKGGTRADGTFRLTGLADAPLLLQVRKGGELLAELRELEPDTEGIEVVLGKPTGIAGTVLAARSGEPLRAFKVKAFNVKRLFGAGPDGRHTWEGPNREFSSEDGSFEWGNLKPGLFDFQVEASGFVPAKVEDVDVRAGEMRRGLEFRLTPAVTILGTVMERGTGAPIAGAVVSRILPDGFRFGRDGESTKSASDGTFRLGELGAGAIRLRVSHGRYVETTTEAIEGREGETVEGLTIALSLGGGIEGFARGEDGLPYAEGHAWAVSSDSSPWSKSTEIDEEGYFRLEGLAPGKWRVEAQPAWTEARTRDAIEKAKLSAVAFVEEGRITRVDFSMPPKGRAVVRGRVFRGNQGLPGVEFFVEPRSPSGDPDEALLHTQRLRSQSDSDGNYRVEGVPGGEASLLVVLGQSTESSSGFSCIRPISVPEGGELVVDFPLPSGEISGRVVGASDGAPIPGLFVRALPADRSERVRTGWSADTATDSGGRYRLKSVPAGSYLVMIRSRMMGQDRRTDELASAKKGPVEVGEGGRAVVDFVLEKGGIAVVEVRDPEGKSVEGASVWLFPARPLADPFLDGHHWAADAYGVAKIKGLAPGLYYAAVSGVPFAGAFSEEKEVRVGEEARFRMDLRGGTRVRVRVVGEDGAPVGRWSRLLFLDPQGRPVPVSLSGSGGARREDRGFTVVHLLPGAYTLDASAPGYRKSSTQVSVGASSPQDFEVRLEREPK